MEARCQGYIKKYDKNGNPIQCKRTTTDQYCWQHKIKELKPNGFPEPHKSLTKRQTNRIDARIKRGPTKKDEKGWIYIYRLPCDDGLSYYKIGRTSGSVSARLSKWNKNCKLVTKWYTKNHKFCETLIHNYLDPWRVYRYVTKVGFCTIWKTSGDAVYEKDKELKLTYKLQGRKKQIEWFKGDIEYFSKLVSEICSFY
jgi:hypothetical protein